MGQKEKEKENTSFVGALSRDPPMGDSYLMVSDEGQFSNPWTQFNGYVSARDSQIIPVSQGEPFLKIDSPFQDESMHLLKHKPPFHDKAMNLPKVQDEPMNPLEQKLLDQIMSLSQKWHLKNEVTR
jgi:hypothetical protein